MKKFNIELLSQIPVDEVCELLGARYKGGRKPYTKSFSMHCFCGMHQHGDKNPSLVIWKDSNICKCMVNPEVKGDPISIVKKMLFDGDFKEACIWLHENFGIPYLEEGDEVYSTEKGWKEDYADKIKRKTFKPVKHMKEKKTECLEGELKKPYKKIKIEEYLTKYMQLKPHQRAKLIYSYVYRFSLNTIQYDKEQYYKKRKITHKDIEKIGYLSNEDIEELLTELTNIFPVEDLIEFKIINPADHPKRALQFKYIPKRGSV